MGNIRNMENYMDAVTDWSYLNDCFDRGIRVSDVDGIVEANGSFLMIEAKGKGVPVPYGQRLMLRRFAKMPNCYVLILWGDPPRRYKLLGVGEGKNKHCDKAEVKRLVKAWFEWVDDRPRQSHTA